MAILIYDYCELEERAGRHLRVWKIWHIIIFIFAAIFGLLNYIFLRNTMSMVGDNCILIAPKIELKTVWVEFPNDAHRITNSTGKSNETAALTASEVNGANTTHDGDHIIMSTTGRSNETEASTAQPPTASEVPGANRTKTDIQNSTISGEEREVLDLVRTYFGSYQDCEYAEFAPLGAAMGALLWLVLFLMCPGGGHSRSGLSEPWRILAPALLCSLVLVGVTGHGFTLTNRGLRDFCAAFQNHTNATTCSSVNVYLEASWNTSWAFSSRAEATRAASAALWVCWAGAATLLIVRCLAAPDFQLRKTGVYLTKDPKQKVTPYLRKTRGRATPSPNKSARSVPTATTELVTASFDDSSSITDSPVQEHVSSV